MATPTASRNPLFFWVSLISTLGAVGVHYYLTLEHFKTKYGAYGSEISLCELSGRVSCALASVSDYAEFFGLIPMAILGFIVNGLVAAMLISHRWSLVSPGKRLLIPGILQLTVLGVFAASLVMAYISFAVINVICPFCMVTYGLSAISALTTWLYLGGGFAFSRQTIIGTLGVGFVTLGLGAAFNASQKIQYGGKSIDKTIAAVITDWQNQPEQTIETVTPLVLNPLEKPVLRMVEFADYLCPHCKVASPILKLFVQSRPDVTLEFQAFPLDGNCNEALPMGDGTRCLLARFTYCSQQEEPAKGWAAQKWIFDNQSQLISLSQAKEKIAAHLPELGLSKELMDQCLESEKAHQAIKDQATLGRQLKLSGTPSLFVNGRKVQGIHLPVLQKLYQEIKKAK